MQGSGWPANSVNSFWKCFTSGTYKFKITDGYGDGLCCSYGDGGYVVKVDDKEVISGGDFDSEETKTFEVAPSTPTTPSPSTSAPGPAPYPTDIPPTTYPTKKSCGVKGDPCTKHNKCCGGKCNLISEKCRK